MAVKWIKITTSMFDDEKIKLIETMPDKDTILIIWIKLLTLAGKTNASGYIFLNENIPYTDEMLAAIFDRPVNTVRMALDTFKRFGMIEVDDNQFILISNWEKHQNIDGMERIREQERLRKRKQRERQRLMSPVTKRDGDYCQYCGGVASGFDHVIPVSRGGSDDEENKVPCCTRCNNFKSTQTLVAFLNGNRNFIKNDLVMSNTTIMRHVRFDDNMNAFVSRDVTGQVTGSHALDIDIEIDKERDKENNKRNIYTPEFEQFWEVYPRRLGKKGAFSKFKSRLKDHSFETILTCTKNYAAYCKDNGTEERFVKHPETFLSDKEPFLDFLEYERKGAKPNAKPGQSYDELYAGKDFGF